MSLKLFKDNIIAQLVFVPNAANVYFNLIIKLHCILNTLAYAIKK